ncbi:MAG: hypothetical protein RR215_06650 [Ruthenibacterium sp.]
MKNCIKRSACYNGFQSLQQADLFLNAGQNAVRFDPAQAPLALPPRKIQEAIIQSSFHRGRTNASRTAAVPAFAAPSGIALRQKITERRHKEPGITENTSEKLFIAAQLN